MSTPPPLLPSSSSFLLLMSQRRQQNKEGMCMVKYVGDPSGPDLSSVLLLPKITTGSAGT